MSNTTNKVMIGCRLIAAFILLQTLYFKFSAAPESVYIFSTIGMEPWGRIGSGTGELIASILLLISSTAWIGALMAAGLMIGAIFFHLTLLGIEVMDDHGQLFIYAIIVLITSSFIIYQNKGKLLRFARQQRQ